MDIVPDAIKQAYAGVVGRFSNSQYHPVSKRNMPLFRELIRTLYPRLTPQQRASFGASAAKVAGTLMNFEFPHGPKTQDSTRDSITRLVASDSSFRKALDLEYQEFNRNQIQTPGSDQERQVQGKLTLRSRFVLPGPETLQESDAQAVSDNVQSDLFGFLPTCEGGINNNLFLQQKQNEAMNWISPSEPRSILPPVYDMPFPIPWQYGEQDIGACLHDAGMEAIGRAIATHSTLNFMQDGRDPLVTDAPQPGPYSRPLYDPLPAFSGNALGFKPIGSYWRRGLFPGPEPSQGPGYPSLASLQEMESYGPKTFETC